VVLWVNAFICFFKKCHIYALSCVNAFIWSWHVLVAWLCLICGWIASLLIIWGQRRICHHECLAPLLYLVEGHKFFFVAKTFHVPNMNLKMKCKMLGKCAPMSYVLNLILLWVLNRCMMPTNEKSHTQKQAHGWVALTWHEVLVGVCDGLMTRMAVLTWSLCGFAILICFDHV
jgi:hypothetical protein